MYCIFNAGEANLQSYVPVVHLSRGSRGKAACQTAAEGLISNLHLKGGTRVRDYNGLWSSPYNVHIISLPEPWNAGWEKMTEKRISKTDACLPTCYQHSEHAHLIPDRNADRIADKILPVSSPERKLLHLRSVCWYQLILMRNRGMLPKRSPQHQKPGEIPSLQPPFPTPHPFLCHPHPNINIHGAAGPWRSWVHGAREEMQEGWRECW